MEKQNYYNLHYYLTNNQHPNHLNEKECLKLTKHAKFFIVQNNLLYKIDKRIENNYLRVLKQEELGALLYMMHNDPISGHFATDIMFEKIRKSYYWPQMYENIKEYVQACDSCQRRGKPKRQTTLHPIPVYEPFYQIGIDFVGPLPRTARGKQYIIVAIDYLTKWPEARAVSEATAQKTAEFVYEQIICQHGCPKIILSDQGTHFNNNMVDKLLGKFKVNHLLSTPYHPQTNGLVERFNKTLCESLAKLALRTNDWDLFIAPTLFAYRTSKNATIKIEPFFLVYGRDARLPVDQQNITSDNVTPETLNDRLIRLIDDVPQIREKARSQITEMQRKQKVRHDNKLKKEVQYNIGDKVLYFEAAKAQSKSGKLDPKWKGPYYIYSVLPNDAYKLRTADNEGRVLATPVNGNLLKLYHETQITI